MDHRLHFPEAANGEALDERDDHREKRMLIEMKVASLTVAPFSNMPILILRNDDGETLPIWVGLVEASAIAAELESIHLDRPMTHDLLKTILGLCAIQLDRVEVYDLRNN